MYFMNLIIVKQVNTYLWLTQTELDNEINHKSSCCVNWLVEKSKQY